MFINDWMWACILPYMYVFGNIAATVLVILIVLLQFTVLVLQTPPMSINYISSFAVSSNDRSGLCSTLSFIFMLALQALLIYKFISVIIKLKNNKNLNSIALAIYKFCWAPAWKLNDAREGAFATSVLMLVNCFRLGWFQGRNWIYEWFHLVLMLEPGVMNWSGTTRNPQGCWQHCIVMWTASSSFSHWL